MQHTHSKLFEDITKPPLGELRTNNLNIEAMQDFLRQQDTPPFDVVSDLLLEYLDAQDGIVSGLQEGSETVWVRDATKAIPLEQRENIPYRERNIVATKTLLRCLSRWNAINYALNKKYPEMPEQRANELTAIKTQFIKMTKQLYQADNHNIKIVAEAWEGFFNTELISLLAHAGLTKDCAKTKDAERLLQHYRNLSGLLRPSKTTITVTYDEELNVIHRETHTPVTKKTAVQQAEIEKLRIVSCAPLEKAAHTAGNLAIREATQLFVDEIIKDNTMSGAQNRKEMIAAGVCNAFVVEQAIFYNKSPEDFIIDAQGDKVLYYARQGSPVYVGKGETDARRELFAAENIKQIMDTYSSLYPSEEPSPTTRPVLIVLNTPAPSGIAAISAEAKTDTTIVRTLKKVSENKPSVSFNNIPVNKVVNNGPLHFLRKFTHSSTGTVDKDVFGNVAFNDRSRTKRTKALVAELLKNIIDRANYFFIINCASGQDRTTVVHEAMKQAWILACHRDQYPGVDPAQLQARIEAIQIGGGNATVITSAVTPGSDGVKKTSQPKQLFSPVAAKYLFLESADTNKENLMSKVEVKEKLKLAMERELYLFAAKHLLAQHRDLYDAFDKAQLQYPNELPHLVSALRHIDALETTTDNQRMEHANQLMNIGNKLHGHGSLLLQSIGFSLLLFGFSVILLAITAICIFVTVSTAGTALIGGACAASLVVGSGSALLGAGFFKAGGRTDISATVHNHAEAVLAPTT